MARSKTSSPSYATLTTLIGKTADDVAVVAAGDVKVTADRIMDKATRFEFTLERPAGAKRTAPKQLHTLFLYEAGGFTDLPAGFTFTTRDTLRAHLPTPDSSHIYDDVVMADRWIVDGFQLSASYDKGAVQHFIVTIPSETGGDLSTHPVHFETTPPDAPKDAGLVGMSLIVAWAAHRFGLPKKHAGTPLVQQLLDKSITPRTFLTGACNSTMTTLDVDKQAVDFLYGYTNRLFPSDDSGDIYRLLRLQRSSNVDERAYTDDYLGTFRHVVDSPFYVPDNWDAVARMGAILDARFTDFEATKFKAPPNVALYARAAQLRDAIAITPDRGTVAAVDVAPNLADTLLALIGKSLTDKNVKATLEAASLPVGKRIDQQANPLIGVAYMGSKFDIDGKKVLGVSEVSFFADKRESYIRGIGNSVAFVGFPAALPHGLSFGQSKIAVVGVLGKPSSDDAELAQWQQAHLTIACHFINDKLVEMSTRRQED
jgi:hypothetical protein